MWQPRCRKVSKGEYNHPSGWDRRNRQRGFPKADIHFCSWRRRQNLETPPRNYQKEKSLWPWCCSKVMADVSKDISNTSRR